MKRKSNTPRSKHSDEHVEPMLVTGYSETKMISFADRRSGPEDELSEREQMVLDALDKIPEPEARVMWGWIQGKAQDAMAKEEGVTQAAISYRIDRAKRRLKDLLPLEQVKQLAFTPKEKDPWPEERYDRVREAAAAFLADLDRPFAQAALPVAHHTFLRIAAGENVQKVSLRRVGESLGV